MNRRELIMAASLAPTPAYANAFRLDVQAYGALGDGIADDASAIQKVLDQLGRQGGGVALLPKPTVHYRIGRGLKLPSHVVLEGTAPVQYPFNAGNKGVCALVADFADHRQWIIEPATRTTKGTIPFNQVIGGALPAGVTYNCGVKNILLTSKGKVPFGGIRMQGCPGSFIDKVSIDRVGCGILVNHCSGGDYRANIRALYYGVAAWDDVNANSFQVYCSQSTPWPKIVPVEYQISFMAQMGNNFVDTLKLSTESHAGRPYGILCGSIGSTSIGNVFDAVIEHFPGAIFLYNAYATDFRQCYIESEKGGMVCAIAASRSRFSIQALHAFLSGSGMLFDFGIDIFAKICASGIIHAEAFGKPPFDNGESQLTLEGVRPGTLGAPIQRGIRYSGGYPTWVPLSLVSDWRPVSDNVPAVRFDPWSHRVECRGSMEGGKKGECFVLPAECRPSQSYRYMAAGGVIEISADGEARVVPTETLVSLDGISFARW